MRFFNKVLFTAFILFIWNGYIFFNKGFNPNIIIFNFVIFLKLSMINTILSKILINIKKLNKKIIWILFIPYFIKVHENSLLEYISIIRKSKELNWGSALNQISFYAHIIAKYVSLYVFWSTYSIYIY